MGKEGTDDEEYQIKPKTTRLKKVKSRKQVNMEKHGDEFDTDCEGDSQDIEYLDGLNDIQRNEIIMERKEEREKRQKLEKLQKEKVQEEKRKKLDSLKRGGGKQLSDSESDKSGSDDEDDDNDDDYKDSDNDDEEDEEEDIDQKLTTNEKNQEFQDKLEKNLKRITLTRDQLENIYQKQNFSELVEGLYVRARNDMNSKDNAGQYIFSKILKVKKGNRMYSLSNGQTDYLLILEDGKSEKQFLIKYVSNQVISQTEFTQWFENKLKQNDLPKLKQITTTLENFEKKKRNSTQIDHAKVIKEKINQINKKIEQKLPMSRDEITHSINLIEQKVTDNKLRQEACEKQEKKTQFQDKIQKYENLLDQLKQARDKATVGHSYKKHQFFVRQMAGYTRDTKQKAKSKAQEKQRKINEKNQSYMQELEMNKKFGNFQQAEELKRQYQNIHSRELPDIEQTILSWN